MHDISHIQDFLPCATPPAWIGWALQHPDILLIDHAHCEKKAASTPRPATRFLDFLHQASGVLRLASYTLSPWADEPIQKSNASRVWPQ